MRTSLDLRIRRSILLCIAFLFFTGGAYGRASALQNSEARQSQLISDLRSNDKRVRRRAAEELGRIGGDQAVAALIDALRDQDQLVCSAAALALGEIKDKRATSPLLNMMRNTSGEVRGAVAVALGRIGDQRAVDALFAMLGDAEVYPRSSAAVALGRIGDARAVAPIASLLARDPDSQVRTSAAEALGQLGDARAKEALIAAVKDQNNYVRTAAVSALGLIGAEGAVLELIEALKDADRLVRSAAAESLGRSNDVRAVRPLIESLSDPDQFVRTNAAYALGRIGNKQAVEPLMDAVHLDDVRVRSRAVDSLGAIGDPRALPVLVDALRDKDRFTRSNAVIALGKIGDRRAVEPLLPILSDQDGFLRRTAVDALGKLGDDRAFDPIAALIKKDLDQNVRIAAVGSAAKIGGSRAVPVLIETLLEKSPDLRNGAALALSGLNKAETMNGLLGIMASIDLNRANELQNPLRSLFKEAGPEMGDQLKQALSSADVIERQRALLLTAIIADSNSFDSILAALKDPDPEMRSLSALLIGRARNTKAAPQLRIALSDSNADVRARAADALALMGLPKYDLPDAARNNDVALQQQQTRTRSDANLIAAHSSATAIKKRPQRPLPASEAREDANAIAGTKPIAAPVAPRASVQMPPAPPPAPPEPKSETVASNDERRTTNDEREANETAAAIEKPAPDTKPSAVNPTIDSPANLPASASRDRIVRKPEPPKTDLPPKSDLPKSAAANEKSEASDKDIIALGNPPAAERVDPVPTTPKIEIPKEPPRIDPGKVEPLPVIMARNEAAVIASLQRIFAAQQRRRGENIEYAALNKLAEDGFIEENFAREEQNGYEFTIYISPATAKRASKFFIIASPIEHGRSGERAFFIDETGILRSNRANNGIQIGQIYGSWNRIEN